MIAGLRAMGRLLRRQEGRAAFAVFLGLLVVGTVFYSLVEDWTLIEALYFSVVTLTTTGFGDLTPTTDASRLFTIFYLLTGVGVFVAVATAIAREAFAVRSHDHDHGSGRATP